MTIAADAFQPVRAGNLTRLPLTTVISTEAATIIPTPPAQLGARDPARRRHGAEAVRESSGGKGLGHKDARGSSDRARQRPRDNSSATGVSTGRRDCGEPRRGMPMSSDGATSVHTAELAVGLLVHEDWRPGAEGPPSENHSPRSVAGDGRPPSRWRGAEQHHEAGHPEGQQDAEIPSRKNRNHVLAKRIRWNLHESRHRRARRRRSPRDHGEIRAAKVRAPVARTWRHPKGRQTSRSGTTSAKCCLPRAGERNDRPSGPAAR